ncbi:MAG: DUF2975 domain-containing protein [Muribaculaceae bacterium]|nr:DUF2975 domain-containing protein [Muribaculaceae bacterium]
MNKILINTLSTVIILILACSIGIPIVLFGFNFIEKNKNFTEIAYLNSTPVEVILSPKNNKIFETNTHFITSDGQKYPMMTKAAIIMVPESHYNNHTLDWVIITSMFISMIALIILIYYFVRLIISINKGRIFVRENVKILNAISICLLIMAFLSICSGIADYMAIGSLNLSSSEISLGSSWEFPWSNLLIGFTTLLIAQIWKRGIYLREDSELTI